MTETENRLRSAMNNLLLMITLTDQIKQGVADFEALLSISDFEQRAFEKPSKMTAFTDAKESFYSAFEKIKATYGKSVISEAYEAFKTALGEETFREDIGLETVLSPQDTATLFNAAFNRMMSLADALPDETDGYAVLVATVKDIREGKGEELPKTDICPYCDGVPSRMARSDFFGSHCDDSEGFVWCCECGAYANIGKNGKIIGTIADSELHHKRRAVKRIVFDLCALVGLTVYEGCKWVDHISGRRVNVLSDIEYLSDDNCAMVLSCYDKVKEAVKAHKPVYPKTHGELMQMLSDGGRMMVKNAFGYKYGRVFVPIKVGTEAFSVRYNKKLEEIMLPKGLDYSFNGSHLTVTHPSGKKEKYKLFTKEERTAIYKEETDNV